MASWGLLQWKGTATQHEATRIEIKGNTPKAQTKKLCKNKKEVMKGHPDLFAEMHQQIRTHSLENKPGYKENHLFTELEKAKAHLQSRKVNKSKALRNMEIVERGPANVGGRTRAIAVDSSDATLKTWFAGAVGGGVWKTTDAGEHWENLTPDIPNLAISALVQAPSNPNVLYAGTGEGFYNLDAIRGDGLIKSTDYGETWQQVSNTITLAAVNRIIVDPADENTLLAAVNSNNSTFSRICKSTDGGDSWTNVYEEPNKNRIQQIAYHPSDFSVQYATVNAVGVLKSTNAGESWEQILDLSAHERSEIAIAPSNPQVIYAAVESQNQYGGNIAYLFKTTDGGNNWEDLSHGGQLPNWLGAQGWYDNALAVNPYNEDDVFLGGIHVWRLGWESGGISSIEENNTSNFLKIYPLSQEGANGIMTGEDFSAMTGLPAPIGLSADDYSSIELRFGNGASQMAHLFKGNSNGIEYSTYAEVPFEIWDTDNNKQLMFSFVDVNDNGTFDLIEITEDMGELIFVHQVEYDENNPNASIMGSGGYGFMYKLIYTMNLGLAPGAEWNPGNLPESDLSINYAKDGEQFASIRQLSYGYPAYPNGTHADHHNLTILKTNEQDSTFRIINGNDGGIFYSDNEGETWTNTLNSYLTTQFYGIDKKHGAEEYFGGMQDNGTWQSPKGVNSDANTDWNLRIGGDGYETAWNYDNPNLMLGGYQFNGLMRSTNGGTSWQSISHLVDNGSGNAPFVTKIAKSNSDPDLIFAVGSQGVWRSDDFAESFQLVPIPFEQWHMNSLTQVEISYADPRIVWAGSYFNDPNRPEATVHVSTDGGASFTPIANNMRLSMGRITGINSHPTDKNTAYMLFSFADHAKILRTTDLGENWEDISSFQDGESTNGFPDVATFCVLAMPHNPEILWAGTEIGLFESTDNGESWHYAIEEFPAVSIWQMKVVDNQVVIATHGRGVITITINELPAPPVVTKVPAAKISGASLFDSKLEITAKLRSPYDSTLVFVQGEKVAMLEANTEVTQKVFDLKVEAEGNVRLQLKAYNDGEEYPSGYVNYEFAPLLAPANIYTNALHEENNHFVGDGFNIEENDGFENKALHSSHPYNNNINNTYMLRVPVIVREKKANLRFNEVALMEPGESGSNYGSNGFYDYAVVEGSKDGVNWKALAPGYDARAYSEWQEAFNTGQAGNNELYKKRVIDLQDKFSTGDTILIRFRMYSDSEVNGWGWAIDSLAIQDEEVGVFDKQTKQNSFAVSVYPNPAYANVNISINNTNTCQISAEVFDINGRKVDIISSAQFTVGAHTLIWNTDDFEAGTYFIKVSANNESSVQKILLVK
jgi:photosystem II stability/assembly factor-like uncharacterized protein